MALYEGISLIQEKQAVVLDLGYDYIKFGFAGEPAPRCVVRAEFWCPAARRRRRVFDYRSRDELYDNLVQMLHTLYFRHVLVNPKERRVIVCESLLTPTLVRDTLADVLLTHYEVAGCAWLGSARAAALALAAPTVLVVDVGAREVQVTPVVHGWAALSALQWAPLGARALHARLRDLLLEDNPALPPHALDDRTLEDIKVKTCFVGTRARAEQWAAAGEGAGGGAPAHRGLQYRCGGALLAVSGRARELPAEIMFQRDHDAASLPDLLLQALAAAPRDARVPLAASVALCGGGVLPGLTHRLHAELLLLLRDPLYSSKLFIKTFKFHSPGTQPNILSWVGAAAAGAGPGGVGAGAGVGGASRGPGRGAGVPARALDWPSLLNHRDKYEALGM